MKAVGEGCAALATPLVAATTIEDPSGQLAFMLRLPFDPHDQLQDVWGLLRRRKRIASFGVVVSRLCYTHHACQLLFRGPGPRAQVSWQSLLRGGLMKCRQACADDWRLASCGCGSWLLRYFPSWLTSLTAPVSALVVIAA